MDFGLDNYKILHMVLNIELTMTIIVSLPHLENMMQVIVMTKRIINCKIQIYFPKIFHVMTWLL